MKEIMPPRMRGMLKRQVKIDIATAFVLGFLGASAWWYGVAVPRRKAYEDFYKNYTPSSTPVAAEGDGEF